MEENTELQLRIEDAESVRTIHMVGDLSIVTAGALRTALIEGLRPGFRTVLEASGVTAVDLSGLQLLCSAHRTYQFEGAALAFGGISEALARTAVAAGFEAPQSHCPYRRGGDCLWKW